ncbi:putative glutathione-specific gamma-glutamylcyclotransferase 2 isoform X2 [Lycorma delicatula]|uniref:putative glutathione-specific gamma-glutamylcyclotransferase 2 isoform X2 n=1 Tax=Lycorma delicatula TaxID=130591 RepID=UPI003F512A1F
MDSALWVFGYGSLCWNPGFNYDKAYTGYVKGFTRKFWQGNTTHRGVEGQGTVWGKAFRLTGEAALPYLDNRECVLGGYKTQFATFYVRNDRDENASFPVLIYVARPDNRLWLGDAPLPDIANQIITSKGATGHNVEYLLRLAKFMREDIPEAEDSHLFTLEFLVMTRIKEQNLCLKYLMGEIQQASDPPPEVIQLPEPEPAPELRQNSFQFITMVPPKKLRCLNI